MAKLTLDDLRQLRDKKKKELNNRDIDGKDVEVIIGMGTCGIAAGAKKTFDSFVEELEKQGLSNVIVKQTGCMGACNVEPTVEVRVPEMPQILYANVDAKVAKDIVTEHIIGKKLLQDHVQDKPAIDIIKEG